MKQNKENSNTKVQAHNSAVQTDCIDLTKLVYTSITLYTYLTTSPRVLLIIKHLN